MLTSMLPVNSTDILNWTYQSIGTFAEGPLSHLFVMAKGFIDLVIPPASVEYILTEVPKIVTGQFEFSGDSITQLLMNIGGLAACLLIGILYVAFSLIVGVVFQCCRCSGRCGGHRHHQFGSGSFIKQKIWEFFLFFFIVISTAGILCIVFATGHVRTGISELGPTLGDAIGDLFLFINKTVEGLVNVTDIMVTEFNSTKTSMNSDLDDLGTLVSPSIIQMLTDEGGLQHIFNTVDNLQANAVNIQAKLTVIDGNLTDMVNTTDVLKSRVVVAETWFQDAIDACVTSNCTSALNAVKPAMDAFGDSIANINSSDFKPAVLNTTIAEVDQVLLTNFSTVILEQLNSLPELVNNVSADFIEPVKDALDSVNLTSEITPALMRIKGEVYAIQNMAGLSSIYLYIGFLTYTAPDYGNLVLIVVLGSLATPLLILLTPCCGLWLGLFGTCKERHPTQRGCCSSMGARCLMIAVAKIFMFSWLLMLVTTILFSISAPISRVLCQDGLKTITQLERIAAEQEWFSVQSMLPDDLPVDIDITVTEVMRKCDNDLSLLDAFSLDVIIRQYLDLYLTSSDIDGILTNLSNEVDPSEFSNLDFSVDSEMGGVTAAIQQFDVDLIVSQLGAIDSLFNSSNPGVIYLSDQLQNLSAQLNSTDSLTADKLNDTADQLRGPVYGSLVTINITKSVVVDSLVDLGQDISQISQLINDTVIAVSDLQQYVENNGSDIFVTAARSVVTSLFDRLITFIDNVISQSHQYLRCKPLMDIYHALVDKMLCEYMINPANAMWFCMGEIVFCFVFIIIIAVRLSKYYRRMKSGETDDDDLSHTGSRSRDVRRRSQIEKVKGQEPTTQHFKNQVYP